MAGVVILEEVRGRLTKRDENLKNQVMDFKKERWENQCHKRAQNLYLKETFEKESKRMAQSKI